MASQPQAEIETCSFLFLREITELDQNGLRLVIEEGQASPEAGSIKVGNNEITGCHPVASTDESRLFEVVWDSYVAYCVRNESFAVQDDYEESVGRRFRMYTRSRFLDFIGASTFATDDYPGPFRHIGVICEDHIVDVISTEEPRVTRIWPV